MMTRHKLKNKVKLLEMQKADLIALIAAQTTLCLRCNMLIQVIAANESEGLSSQSLNEMARLLHDLKKVTGNEYRYTR